MKIGNLNMQYTNKSFKVLSISYGHESNASLMINGKLISSVAEERFTKKKCQMGYPKNSINFCLNNSNLKPNDLDQIAIVSKNDMMEQNIVGRIDSFSIEDFLSEQYDYWWPIIYKKKKVDYLEIFKHKINLNQNFKFKNFLKIRKKFKKKTVRIKYFQKLRINTVVEHLKIKDIKKIIHVDHEKGHQYYALFASPKKYRKNCLILTNEGMGDKSNLSVSVVKNEKLKEVFFSKKIELEPSTNL